GSVLAGCIFSAGYGRENAVHLRRVTLNPVPPGCNDRPQGFVPPSARLSRHRTRSLRFAPPESIPAITAYRLQQSEFSFTHSPASLQNIIRSLVILRLNASQAQ